MSFALSILWNISASLYIDTRHHPTTNWNSNSYYHFTPCYRQWNGLTNKLSFEQEIYYPNRRYYTNNNVPCRISDFKSSYEKQLLLNGFIKLPRDRYGVFNNENGWSQNNKDLGKPLQVQEYQYDSYPNIDSQISFLANGNTKIDEYESIDNLESDWWYYDDTMSY